MSKRWCPGPVVGPYEEKVRRLSMKTDPRDLQVSPAYRLCSPCDAQRTSFEVPYHGYQYRGLLNNHIDWNIYFHGAYDQARVALIQALGAFRKRLGYNTTAYDIGAGSGYLTLAMASFADQVVAFEPSPQAYRSLRSKIRDNRIDHITAFPVGCFDLNQVVCFDVISAENMVAKRQLDEDEPSNGDIFRSWLRHGDTYVMANKLPDPDILAINAGDDHLHVLEGLFGTIQKATPVVVISLESDSLRGPLDQLTLRPFLYDDVKLYTLADSDDGTAFKLEPFTESATRIVCCPAKLDLALWCDHGS